MCSIVCLVIERVTIRYHIRKRAVQSILKMYLTKEQMELIIFTSVEFFCLLWLFSCNISLQAVMIVFFKTMIIFFYVSEILIQLHSRLQDVSRKHQGCGPSQTIHILFSQSWFHRQLIHVNHGNQKATIKSHTIYL